MTSTPAHHFTLVVLAVLGSACSSESPSMSQGGGGFGSGGPLLSGGTVGSGGIVQATGGSFASGGDNGPGTGGASTGGVLSSGGTSGTGGAVNATGASTADAGTDPDVAPSAGCGKTRTLQNGTVTIESNGSRTYILRVPDNYANTHPYRLIFAFHWSGGHASDVADAGYFRHWDMANDSTIFVAPEGLNAGWANTNDEDLMLTDAILAQIEGDLCIDTTRIFATGFSFGGGMCIAIACARADVFRGVAFFSGANLSGCEGGTTPIAYYASQASQDHGALPADSPIAGEVIQANFAAVNGCTARDAPIPPTGSGQPHICTKYQNCSSGHPVEYCGFDGPHGWEPVDPGETTSWNPAEAWAFITQF